MAANFTVPMFLGCARCLPTQPRMVHGPTLCPPVEPRPGVCTFLQAPTPLPRLPALLAAKEGPTGTYLGADKQVWAAGFGTQTPYFYDPPIILQQAAQKLQTLTACTKYYLQVGRPQRPAGRGPGGGQGTREAGRPLPSPLRRAGGRGDGGAMPAGVCSA